MIGAKYTRASYQRHLTGNFMLVFVYDFAYIIISQPHIVGMIYLYHFLQ